MIQYIACSLVAISLTPFVATAMTSTHDTDVRAYNLAHGRVVFSEQCTRCHESGRRGAPILGRVGDWANRLQKPLSVLIQNAQDGHGDMPARGDLALPDQDIAAAVAYLTYCSRQLLADSLNGLPATSVGGTELTEIQRTSPGGGAKHRPSDTHTPPRSASHVVLNMFLMLIGQERWR